MANGYSGSPKLQKGAFIEYASGFIGSIPNIIFFQYNPETLSRTLKPWVSPQASDSSSGSGDIKNDGSTASSSKTMGTASAQPYDPDETIRLSLELDATDAWETPALQPVKAISGVADRIAALEMLLYPGNKESELIENIGDSLKNAAGSLNKHFKDSFVPRYSVPLLLFVWGPNRIVPIRITEFSVEEKAFSTELFPIRAKVSVSLAVLTPNDLRDHPDRISKESAIKAYDFTYAQKKELSRANLANSVESILGMLPF